MTLFEKIWHSHVVLTDQDCPSLLYIDLHLIHEVTSPQAFQGLRARNLKVRRPDRTVATLDHIVPTRDQSLPLTDPSAAEMVRQTVDNCAEHGIRLYGMGDPHQGIVHVIGPELGITQPGMTIVCGDSHTSTHGAFGAFAFGIGTSEVEHVLATQVLLQRQPRTFEVRIEGVMPTGTTAKDVILRLISSIGIGGGTGHVLEYTGSAVRALGMEERMTICNMSIEAGARAGMIAPDDVTFEYLRGREFAPTGLEWDLAIEQWRHLSTDEGAEYDRRVTLQAGDLEPMVTYGTNPAMSVKVTERIPDPDRLEDSSARSAARRALEYMGLKPNQPILGLPLDVVFLGSCTNSRITDLRAAARILKGRRVHPSTRLLVVPGSRRVKAEAEAEGLHATFQAAGAEWREPGCSLCIAMNGDELQSGQYCLSTSNRNFEGRQGKGSRTLLASPLTAAASAIEGAVADVRRHL